jgi:hypothetical protein
MPCPESAIPPLMRRLKTLPYFGDAADFTTSRDEVGAALMAAAESEQHAKAIVDGLIRRLHRFPVPADVHEEAEGTRPARSTVAHSFDPLDPIECLRCNDMGWYTVPGDKGRSGYFQACMCAVGRDSLELVAKMNQRFTTTGTARARDRSLSSAEFAKRAGL